MAFQAVEALLTAAGDKPLWQAVREDDCRDRGADRAESWAKMSALWSAMVCSVRDYDGTRRSASGLVGGGGAQMEHAGETLCGPFMQAVISTALKTGECNACMGRIVAAPTAGASGVMPAVLLPVQEKFRLPDEAMIQALYVAAGFGQVIATRASISGAEGGCQAECGVAAAMAAAAAVQMAMGSPGQSMHAVSFALMNSMGLVCDPVAGLVQVPCAQRNASQTANALLSADLALAGMTSVIPADQVVEAMYRVGRQLPMELRETAMGGIAATEAGRGYAKRLAGETQAVGKSTLEATAFLTLLRILSNFNLFHAISCAFFLVVLY